ncbi:MAG TPA: DnaA N-terminal domain-containing protein [Herpetosiphonaceae bacterium]
MQTTMKPDRSALAYDPNETLAAFQARQHRAYEAGRRALHERRIKVQLLHLYESLVRCVGANQYAWVGEAYLAEEFGVDVATIKRWMAKLVQAGLIRRQRRFATTSLTFITTYDRPALVEADDTDDTDEVDPVTAQHDSATAHVNSVSAPAAPQPEVQTAHDAGVSFVPESAPTFGANLRRLNLKTDHLSFGGGESSSAAGAGADREVTQLLEREGVADFFLAPMLSQKSLDELRAVSTYLNHQRNVVDRPKLFAWLVSRDFGAQLLSGKHTRRRKQRPQPPADGQTYLSGELAYLIQGWSAAQEDAPPDAQPVPAPSASQDGGAPPSTLTETWQQVLDRLRQALPASEFVTWFQDAALVDLTTERAVVGVPNIFARETLTQCYQAQIAQALYASCGRAVPVQIELGGP